MKFFSLFRGRKGYTLLEIIIAMFIVMLLLGLAISVTREVFGNEELRKVEQKIALYAKTARRYAMQENRSYEIVLDGNLLTLQPAAKDPGVQGGEQNTGEPLHYQIPKGIRVSVKTWGTEEWVIPKEWIWTFMPNGLCAPNRIRLQRGDSWMEDGFNPLNANRQNETWYLP